MLFQIPIIEKMINYGSILISRDTQVNRLKHTNSFSKCYSTVYYSNQNFVCNLYTAEGIHLMLCQIATCLLTALKTSTTRQPYCVFTDLVINFLLIENSPTRYIFDE